MTLVYKSGYSANRLLRSRAKDRLFCFHFASLPLAGFRAGPGLQLVSRRQSCSCSEDHGSMQILT